MNKKNGEFLKRLLETFKVEAEDHLKGITSGLIELEKDLSSEANQEIIETIFREAHSLKGAARSASRSDIEGLCQSVESVFSVLKRRAIKPHPGLFDALHNVMDLLKEMTFLPDEGEKVPKERIVELKEIMAKIEAGEHLEIKRPSAESGGPVMKPGQAPSETVRIGSEKMVSLLLQIEEMVSVKLTVDRQVQDLTDLLSLFNEWNREWSKHYPEIRAFRREEEKKVRSGDMGINNNLNFKLFEFCETTGTHIKLFGNKLMELKKQAERDRYAIGPMIDHLLEDVKKTLMLPFSMLLEAFPKIIRDLSREQGKEVELTVSGGEIEIDRRILEEMRIPFMHLIRNSLDHGIEKPAERRQKNKPGTGNISITLSSVEGNKVEIVFSDDGQGVDIPKVKETALKQGILSTAEGEKQPDREILPLVFQSGISTSPIITDISGRGLGLAIIKEKVEKLGGRITIESRRNEGVSFKIRLPVSLATFRGVLIKTAGQEFIIPTVHIEKVVKIKLAEIKTVGNRETLSLDRETVPVLKLSQLLQLSGEKENPLTAKVLIFHFMNKRIGFMVDEVLTEQEVLFKNLEEPISRVNNIAGATILGSGRVVPILHVSDLIQSALQYKGTFIKTEKTLTKEEAEKSILVVEDSITSRMLLKNILETSGYRVQTAVDGIDAITRLKIERIDLVVSDVDMPRLNGFDLTAKIRSDKNLSQLPVVLVTALEAREDKERGIDVGANAYIVKSSFDQSNLLEVIQTLI